MVVFPENFYTIGKEITISQIEKTILEIVGDINCNCLSLSGGLDSSLMLWFMLQVHKKVNTFTIGYPSSHPDIEHSILVASSFGNRVNHNTYVPNLKDIGNRTGNEAVKLFYKFVGNHTNKIIACDGIDEYACGYYSHQENPSDETYYKHIQELCEKHLIPLHCNSGNVKVFLPYLDSRLIFLLSQIPINKKVTAKQRKILMMKMSIFLFTLIR